MTTPITTPQAAAFIEATRAFVDHLTALSESGLDAYHAGQHDTARAMLDAVEVEMSEARRQIGAGHLMDTRGAIRFSDSEMGLTELLPQLSALAAFVDGDDVVEVAS